VTWQPGHDRIGELLAAGELEQVTPDDVIARRLLGEAGRHVATAGTAVTTGDLSGAYQLAYDAFRKSAASLLAVQGLRATSRGGHRHVAVQEAIVAQFGATLAGEVAGDAGEARAPDGGALACSPPQPPPPALMASTSQAATTVLRLTLRRRPMRPAGWRLPGRTPTPGDIRMPAQVPPSHLPPVASGNPGRDQPMTARRSPCSARHCRRPGRPRLTRIARVSSAQTVFVTGCDGLGGS